MENTTNQQELEYMLDGLIRHSAVDENGIMTSESREQILEWFSNLNIQTVD